MKTKKRKPERRKHKRMPVLSSLIKLVSIEVPALHMSNPLPGIMGNLSAGGMTIATFMSIPRGTKLELSIDLPGLSTHNLKGEVTRVNDKEGSCLITIAFTEIDRKTKYEINELVMSYKEE